MFTNLRENTVTMISSRMGSMAQRGVKERIRISSVGRMLGNEK
jgi:hypothetical protein